MKFGAIYMAAWLWIVPLVALFYVYAGRARTRAMRSFAGETLIPEISKTFDAQKRKIRHMMIVVAVLFIAFTLLRPQWGYEWQEVKRQGIDILIALDTSNSMLAEDVLPNRLSRAKLAIQDLVKKLRGDRVGLVVFSGTAFLQCPLTADYNGFLLSLDDVDVDTLPIGGTSLAKAVYTAINSYDKEKKQQKVLIVITDGEDLEGGVAKAIERAKAMGIRIFCVGIGSTEGEIIPIENEKGKKGFLKDVSGGIVKTRLVEALLQKMAIETGGMYVRATGAEFGLGLIYDERLSKLEKEEFKSRMEKHYNERFQIPLGFAIFLLFLTPLIGNKRKGV